MGISIISAAGEKVNPKNKILRHHVVNGTFIGRHNIPGMNLSRTKLVITTSGQKVGAFSKSKVIEWYGWTETPYHRSCGG